MASWTVTVRLRKAWKARLARARLQDGAVLPLVVLAGATQGSGPCDPNPQYAYTYHCTYALTQ